MYFTCMNYFMFLKIFFTVIIKRSLLEHLKYTPFLQNWRNRMFWETAPRDSRSFRTWYRRLMLIMSVVFEGLNFGLHWKYNFILDDLNSRRVLMWKKLLIEKKRFNDHFSPQKQYGNTGVIYCSEIRNEIHITWKSLLIYVYYLPCICMQSMSLIHRYILWCFYMLSDNSHYYKA